MNTAIVIALWVTAGIILALVIYYPSWKKNRKYGRKL